ncbi:MAG: hypothetical protein DRG78_00060 [Epsilonproteobacteria bacterium]|nr:MAG: hypothetical protein DRG78_00060 [Campylobacterota bacterium]
MLSKDKKIALFFDSDNLCATYVDQVYKTLESYGKVYIAKSYIDWTINQAKPWKKEIQKFGIEPIQVFPNVKEKGQKKEKFKNASDIKMTIDVCNIINTSEVDLIVLVSSDSDFTSLAIDIKSKLIDCIIFGEYKAPPALRNACTKFIKLPIKIKRNIQSININKIELLRNIIKDINNTNNYILYAEIGKILKEKYRNDYLKYFDKKRWIKLLKTNPLVFNIKVENSTAKVRLN